MRTRYIEIDREHPQPDRVEEAAGVIRSGGLVAFPTETVYGLGGNAFDPEASKKIYAAKGRPSDNPLIAHIADFDSLSELASEIPDTARKLMEKYWPGPMTLIFKKTGKVPRSTTGGLDTVAVRMPSHPVARALIRAAGVPIAAPSANRSGRPSCTRAEHVREDLDGQIDMILDGGQVGIGLESTIIDVTGEIPSLLRPGFISEEMLRETLGDMAVDAASVGPMSPDAHPKAPGMKYRHYAPKADMCIIRGCHEGTEQEIGRLAAEALTAGKKVGILCAAESLPYYEGKFSAWEEKRICLINAGSREDPGAVAHNLFDALRSFDDAGVDVIYSEAFENGQLGGAIMNRLQKAAGYHEITLC